MTIYVNDGLINITYNGTSQCFYGYTLPEALGAFVGDGNTINNKRIERWILK